MKRFWKRVTDWWWKLVLKAKKRAGFIDFRTDIAVTGIVAIVYGTSDDGDTCFSIVPDQQFAWAAEFQGRPTSEDRGARARSLHCEVSPWSDATLHQTALGLKVGQRVMVSGAWGFDGVHSGKSAFWDVVLCLLGHGPYMTGWCEIHPVDEIRLIG